MMKTDLEKKTDIYIGNQLTINKKPLLSNDFLIKVDEGEGSIYTIHGNIVLSHEERNWMICIVKESRELVVYYW